MRKKTALILVIVLALCVGLGLVTWQFIQAVTCRCTPRTSISTKMLPTAQYLVDHPEPTPSFPQFVWSIEPKPGSSVTDGQEVCVNYNVNPFVKAGSTVESDVRELAKRSKITVDGKTVYVAGQNFAILGKDENGNYVLPPIRYCFTVSLPPGAHLFSFSVGTTSGETYSYSWSWVVEG
jgi:hypothetical protein